VSSVPRHSEEELRQQWAFLDALVDRQAASLKSGSQDPEEDDLRVAAAPVDGAYLEEIATLTRRVTTLEDERAALLRRIDLAEEARMAAETGRAAAEAARAAAEHDLADARSRETVERALAEARAREAAALAEAEPPAVPEPAAQPSPAVAQTVAPVRKAPTSKSRRRSWWQRFRE
jgi:hypothetical protein